MKITHVELYEIEIPPISPIARYYPKIYDITLCCVETDEGLEGWGEFQGQKAAGEAQAAALIDEDPLAIDPYGRPDAFTCALLDIAGQAYGIPLHRFFGTQVRDKVPVSYWSCHMEPHETAAEAAIGAGLGFTNHKLKARSWDIVETVRRMKEVTGDGYTVGVDPNTEFALLPNAARLAQTLSSNLSVSEDKNSGMLKLSMESAKPELASDLMLALIRETDGFLKERFVVSGSEALQFYQQKISKARSREHREALAKLIATEEQKLMLATREGSFVVEIMMGPDQSLRPTSPKSSLVLALGLMLGLFLGAAVVLLRKAFRGNEKKVSQS